MKIFLILASFLIALTWACSGDVDVHGMPKSIELTGCGSLLPGPKDAGGE